MNFSALVRTLTGKNKTGQAIYSILDFLPIPQVHNILREGYGKHNLRGKALIKHTWGTLDKPRFFLTCTLSGLYLGGYLEKETIAKTLDTFNQMQPYVSELLKMFF